MAVIDLRSGNEGAGLLALAKFFSDIGQRKHEQELLNQRLAAEKGLLDHEDSIKNKHAAEMAKAIEMFYTQNRPTVDATETLPTEMLAPNALAGMPGVQGAPSDPSLIGPPAPPLAGGSRVPTMAGPEMSGNVTGAQRPMTQEEMLPALFAKLAASGASTEDMQRLNDLLVNRRDYNIAAGAGGEGEVSSPFQTFGKNMADATLETERSEARLNNAAADEDGTVNPNAGMFVTLTDKNGQVIGFYNPKTEVFKENPVEGSRRAGLPTGELNRRGMLSVISDQLNNVERIAKNNADSVGGVFGWRGKMTAMQNAIGGSGPDALPFVSVSEDESKMLRELGNINDMILRARSGAQINEQEAKRLAHLVPNVGDPDFWAKLASFRSEVNTLIGATVEEGGIKGSQQNSRQSAPSSAPASASKRLVYDPATDGFVER